MVMSYMKFMALCVFFMILLDTGDAFATNQIPITKSFTMDKINFDGKWSFYTEWKQSSWNQLAYDDGTTIQLRTAHQGNFIYVFIDDVNTNLWSIGSDRATVCLDSNNNKSTIPDLDDYCFVTTLFGKHEFTLQGGSPLAFTSNLRTISNPAGFTAIGSISDENDRYTNVPHPSYEFRIPIELIGRSADYGFYVGVYHSQSNRVYSWPQDIAPKTSLGIPSPSEWGEIVSPDRSLPEFPLPTLSLVPAFFLVIYLSRLRYR